MSSRVRSICYVDDDPDDHFIFKTALSEIAPTFELLSFYSCDELLAFLKDEKKALPDLIFQDYNMPGMSGTECLTTIKNTERIGHLPIIIYSTSIHKTAIDEASKDGVFKFVEKQNTLNELKGLLKNIFGEIFEEN